MRLYCWHERWSKFAAEGAESPHSIRQFVILRLPLRLRSGQATPLSERSEREAAEDGEGSRTTLPFPTGAARLRCLGHERRSSSQNHICASAPCRRSSRSFAVLRRLSLATLAQRLRQPQDDNCPVVFSQITNPYGAKYPLIVLAVNCGDFSITCTLRHWLGRARSAIW